MAGPFGFYCFFEGVLRISAVLTGFTLFFWFLCSLLWFFKGFLGFSGVFMGFTQVFLVVVARPFGFDLSYLGFIAFSLVLLFELPGLVLSR